MALRASTPPRARGAALAKAAVVVAIVLIVDQITKYFVRHGVAVGDSRSMFFFVHLVHVRNTGVAFNFLSGGGTIVLVFTLLALAVLLGYFLMRPDRPWLWLPTGLLVGGALGNLIDRLANGAVTDFIKLPHWPAFNVADISITFGVFALLWVLEGRRRDDVQGRNGR
jgi:signal peptidase II